MKLQNKVLIFYLYYINASKCNAIYIYIEKQIESCADHFLRR